MVPQSPDEAAKELERAVTKLGLKGLVLQSHARHEYLDDQKYWAIFEKVEKLDVPIYIHPEGPPSPILKYYEKYGFALAGPVLGYAADVALHIMRLIYSGLFDRYPRLKIILGYLCDRIAFAVDYPYEDGEEALKFMREAPICERDKAKIYHLNTRRFLKQ